MVLNNNMAGQFIISLDFELHWGGAEIWNLKEKENYFLGGRKAVVETLRLFQTNEIRATWATVGFLFAKNKEQLLSFSPLEKPSYKNEMISSYQYFDQVGNDETDDPFHFAPTLIEEILATPGQELASHTFSHYYCLEEGQNIKQFKEDLKAAQALAKENFNVQLKSLVFPRNQYNKDYLKVVKNVGIQTVRSNPNTWFWKNDYGKLTPLIRAADTLFPVSKNLSFHLNQKPDILEIPASRFFRPYQQKEKFIQFLKLKRIKNEMTYAAKNNKVYHLWWHPHNFGNDLEKNLHQLQEIIIHFHKLKQKLDFQSVSMIDLKENIHERN